MSLRDILEERVREIVHALGCVLARMPLAAMSADEERDELLARLREFERDARRLMDRCEELEKNPRLGEAEIQSLLVKLHAEAVTRRLELDEFEKELRRHQLRLATEGGGGPS